MKGKVWLAVVTVVGLSLIPLAGAWAQAQPAAKPAPQLADIQIHSGDSIKSVLERLVGQDVTLAVANGGEITGKVTKVEALVVHLSRLVGREFFDAVVRLDSVNVVTVRVRTK
jgi:hypothetical protein